MTDTQPEVTDAEIVDEEFPPGRGGTFTETNGHPGSDVALRAVTRAPLAAADVVDGWVDVARATFHLADQIAGTEFVPAHLRNKPLAVAACILTGRELGIGPMLSLRHVQVVEGAPTLSAEYKRARILGAGHELVIAEINTTRCTLRARRRGQRDWTELTFTLDDARRAGLIKPKGAWITRPRRMLLARASSELADFMFSDVTLGLPTTELVQAGEFDEFAGYDDPPGGSEQDKGKPAGTAKRRTPAKPAARGPAVPLDDHAPAGPEPERPGPDPDTVTITPDHPLHKAIFAAFRDAGVTKRESRLRAAGAAVDHVVGSIDDLYPPEAKAVADWLAHVLDQARRQVARLATAEGVTQGADAEAEVRKAANREVGRLVREYETRRDQREAAGAQPPVQGQSVPAGEEDPGPAEPLPDGSDDQ